MQITHIAYCKTLSEKYPYQSFCYELHYETYNNPNFRYLLDPPATLFPRLPYIEEFHIKVFAP